ncbi:hypothetical protein RR48_04988 [Papilio machaon]|uniref:Uncharacterized protein n=1 Tax=Papilio machaon TaxID=76193 RepID=A0A0N0PBB6_PAPMA|nr:hypothetical protein RR48_04988 [Papilio machaon]
MVHASRRRDRSQQYSVPQPAVQRAAASSTACRSQQYNVPQPAVQRASSQQNSVPQPAPHQYRTSNIVSTPHNGYQSGCRIECGISFLIAR